MTMTDIHNHFDVPAGMMRPSTKKSHAVGMLRPRHMRMAQSLKKYAGQAGRLATIVFTAGFLTASLIIAAVMTFTVSIGIPLISG